MPKLLTDDTIKVELGALAQKELKNHALQIQRKQQQLMKQKLQREHEKSIKVKEIQDQFIRWAQTKNNDNQLRFQKVEKNKQDHIAKIIKKCKDRDKFLQKKHQDFNIVKKKNLNTAWKKAQQFNNSIQHYYESKQSTRKALRNDHFKHCFQQKTYHDIGEVQNQHEKQKMQMQRNQIKISSNSVFINPSKAYSPLNINSSTFYGQMKHSYFHKDNHKQAKQGRHDRIQSASIEETMKTRNQNILQKLKQINKKLQKQRVQQVGQKMVKIQQSRQRKQKNQQKLFKSNVAQKQPAYAGNKDDYRNNQKKKKSQSHKKDNRMYSQQSYKPQPRVKDRRTDVRLRRQQQFEQNILNGYEYLQNIKIRHLKTVIAKNISYNAIQKKLFIERLKS